MMWPGVKGSEANLVSTHRNDNMKGTVAHSEIIVTGLRHDTFDPRSSPNRIAKTVRIRSRAPGRSIRLSCSRQEMSVLREGGWRKKLTASIAIRQSNT